MAERYRRPRQKQNDRVSRQMKNRITLFWGLLLVVGVSMLVGRLAYLQLVDHEDMQAQTASQQLLDQTITPLRGNIYDSTGSVLARSSVVWRITVDPSELAKLGAQTDKDGNPVNQRVDPATVAADLAEILGVDEESLYNSLSSTDSRYKVLARQVEQPTREKVENYASAKTATDSKGQVVDGYTRAKLPINVERDTKREYPYGNFLSVVLGFCNSDGVGAYGLESEYEDVLAGTPGRVITLRNPLGDELPNDSSTTYPAEDGNNLVLTIDANVQSVVEKYLKNAVEKWNVQQRGMAIVMDVNSGAILAMAVEGGFDPNEPNVITDSTLQSILDTKGALSEEQKGLLYRRLGVTSAEMAKEDYSLNQILADGVIDDDEYGTVQGMIRYAQWKNKCLTALYIPGSVFKVVTSAMGLDSGAATTATSFGCYGSFDVSGTQYGCASNASHGVQDLATALRNSCNIYYVQLGQKIGAKTFYDYFKAFGFTEPTGIDLPSETRYMQYYDEAGLGPVQLASSSFGQAQKITALQTITAVAAAVNGGYLVQPHVVAKITDGDGNLVRTMETSPKRQVISEETSAQIRSMMESVVGNGNDHAPGRNAYVAGYRVGGKSGTSEKLDEPRRGTGSYRFASSFMAVAPANDPQIAVLVVLDDAEADTDSSLYLSGPVAGNIISEIAPYLGIETQYSDTELAAQTVTVPSQLGQEWSQAQVELNKSNLGHRKLENGTTVTHQYPDGGAKVPAGTTVYLYTESTEDIQVTVPDVAGRDAAYASTMLKATGLNVKVEGDGQGRVLSQNCEVGSQVPMGTIVTITCGTEADTAQEPAE